MAEIEVIELPDATTEPLAYRSALLAVIGDRDPLEVMEETPGRVRALIRDRGQAELQRPFGEDGWSAAEVIGHLVDVDIVYGFRWRLALTADRLCQLLEALRAYNVWLLRSIPRAEWSRAAVHEEQGEEAVEVMVRKVAGHDLAHLNQLERALAR